MLKVFGHCNVCDVDLYEMRDERRRCSRIQHGPNPEHSKEFTAEQMSCYADDGCILQWLLDLHDYEIGRRFVSLTMAS